MPLLLYVKGDGTAFYVHDGGDPQTAGTPKTDTDVYTFTFSDGTNEVTKTITVTTSAVDDTAPAVVGETVSVEVGSTTIFDGGTGNQANLLTNDTETEGTKAIATVNGVAYASLAASTHSGTYSTANSYKQVVTSTGTLYIKSTGGGAHQQLNPGTANESFSYTVTDGTNESTTATIAITVADSNAPTGINNITAAINEGATTENLTLLKGVSDAADVTVTKILKGTTGTATALSAVVETSGVYEGFSKLAGDNGILYVKGDGTAFYVHDGGDPQTAGTPKTDTDVYTFTFSDGTNEVTKTITVTTSAVNDAPVLAIDSNGVTTFVEDAVATAAGAVVATYLNDSESHTHTILLSDTTNYIHDASSKSIKLTATTGPVCGQ